MKFTWVINEPDLRRLLAAVHAGEMSPDEVIDELYLNSTRQYLTRTEDGEVIDMSEQEAFEREDLRQNGD